MRITEGRLQGILIIEPDVFYDYRGFFLETYNKRNFEKIGIKCDFVQDNLSYSVKNTIRGLHYQVNRALDKLVRVTSGEVFDVAVDVRRGSPTFGQWESCCLSAENKKMFFIPKGFAHGFCVIGDYAGLYYKCSDFYSPENERGILWNDPDLAIDWPVKNPIISKKDAGCPRFRDAEVF